MSPKGGLRDLLIDEMRDLYDADKQLVKAWATMARAATAESLVTLCHEGVDYTKERIRRLDRVFDLLDAPARGKRSHAMSALIRQALEAVDKARSDADRDAILLSAIRKVSHYGRAGYGAAYLYARAMCQREAADILHESLEEKNDAMVEEAGMARDEIVPRVIKAENARLPSPTSSKAAAAKHRTPQAMRGSARKSKRGPRRKAARN